ncbi:MAG: hypothetical protein Q7K13_04860 [Polynucleobacter sp.]|uniref:hypothetical protein n=1 Tax=Polynucleobacter sp. TaxID=2029855 RepID=UPI0027253F1B|nr:hypothetical protein [Polynucleobacter sp.]MDO8713793.1 hypothetical protein [Polynucleobacter sp.]
MRLLIKEGLRKLPYGLGDSLVRLAQVAIMSLSPRNLWSSWKKKHFYRLEVKRIRQAMSVGIEEFVLIFDESTSVLAFGEFLNFLMVGRYIIAKGCFTRVIIINSRESGDCFAQFMDSLPVQAFINERLELAKAVLKPEFSAVEMMTWEEYSQNLRQYAGVSYIVFKDLVKLRKPIYNHCLNLLNRLMKSSSTDFQEKLLLSSATLYSQSNQKTPRGLNKRYVALACRQNNDWRSSSNLNAEEFCNVVRFIREKFPEDQIVVVSDNFGCVHFRRVATEHGIKCSFSSDISEGFLGSMSLVLSSNLFVQLKGGGIGTAAVYSRTPYFINAVTANELMFADEKIVCWATDEQTFVNSQWFSAERFSMFLKKVKEISE